MVPEQPGVGSLPQRPWPRAIGRSTSWTNWTHLSKSSPIQSPLYDAEMTVHERCLHLATMSADDDADETMPPQLLLLLLLLLQKLMLMSDCLRHSQDSAFSTLFVGFETKF